jgi:hypothetical protein
MGPQHILSAAGSQSLGFFPSLPSSLLYLTSDFISHPRLWLPAQGVWALPWAGCSAAITHSLYDWSLSKADKMPK